MKWLRKQKIAMRNALSRSEKQELVLAAAVSRDVYDVLDVADVDVTCFNEAEESVWHLWNALRQFGKRYNRLPNRTELRLTLDETVNQDDNSLDEETFEEIEDLLFLLDDREAGEYLRVDTARDYAARLLIDRNWREVQQITASHGKTPKDVRGILEDTTQKIVMAESLGAQGVTSSFPDGYEDEHIVTQRVPYGLELIDKYLDGGGAAGEIYLLTASFGSCKTTIAQQLSISLALSQFSAWEDGGDSLGFVYFVSYELPKQTMRLRAIANAANIPFNVLDNRLPLSTSQMLNERDKVMFADQLESGLFVPGETERKRSAEQRLNANWRILDFSGLSDDGRMSGGGNLEEVRQWIDADMRNLRKRGMPAHVAGIFIDYLGMMARRHCMLRNLDDTVYLRSVLSNAPDIGRRLLAYHFQCPVFMVHQMSAQGNAMKPGVIPDRTLTAECKTLSENFDFVFVAARTTDDEHKLTNINCQKARRASWVAPVTLQVQGQFARVMDVSKFWQFDEYSKQFYQVTELDRDGNQHRAKTRGNTKIMTGRRDDD